jgi:hypothetical protein
MSPLLRVVNLTDDSSPVWLLVAGHNEVRPVLRRSELSRSPLGPYAALRDVSHPVGDLAAAGSGGGVVAVYLWLGNENESFRRLELPLARLQSGADATVLVRSRRDVQALLDGDAPYDPSGPSMPVWMRWTLVALVLLVLLAVPAYAIYRAIILKRRSNDDAAAEFGEDGGGSGGRYYDYDD